MSGFQTNATFRTIDIERSSNDPFRILAIPGSLRRQSYNRGLLRAAQRFAPNGVDIHHTTTVT